MNNILSLKNSLVRQKSELQQLLMRNIVPRKAMLQAQELKGSNSIKAIIGPRRAGKSTFAMSLVKLFSNNENVAYLNFDDQALMSVIDHNDLFNALQSVYGENTKLILLDEIQNLKDWEVWLNGLHRIGYNLIVTGSNANLLSRELATHLTGRITEIEILPFSFSEYEKTGGTFNDFFNLGGYPDILLNAQNKQFYLDGLKNSIILKDIVTRFKIRSSAKIEDCFELLLRNPAALFTYKSIANAVQVQSETTIRKYVNYLIETYLFFELVPFSFKTKAFQRSPKKGYVIDNAFLDLIPNTTSLNLSRKLENFVFLELIKTGLKPNKNLFYYRTKNNQEVDFVIKKGLKVDKLVQVSFNIDSLETRNRETSALLLASKELSVNDLEIVTWDTELNLEEEGKLIRATPIQKFLERRL